MILVPPPPQALRLFFLTEANAKREWLETKRRFTRFLLPAFFARKFSSREGRLDPVVRNLISANLMLNFNTGFFFFSWDAFSQMIPSILFRAPNYRIVDKKN